MTTISALIAGHSRVLPFVALLIAIEGCGPSAQFHDSMETRAEAPATISDRANIAMLSHNESMHKMASAEYHVRHRRRTHRSAAQTANSDHAQEIALPGETLTVSGDNEVRAGAIKLLDDSVARLGHIDRNKLIPSALANYDEASSFVASARAAIKHQDFLAADGLARKASLLTGELGGTEK